MNTINKQDSVAVLRKIIAEMNNFADVADRCALTEGNAPVAIRAWSERLAALQSQQGEAVEILEAATNDDAGHEYAKRYGVPIYEVDFGEEGKGRYVRLRDFNQVAALATASPEAQREDTSCGYQGYEFGAGSYPDSVCIDGRLHDADHCDNDGNVYLNEEDVPCPICRPNDAIDYWAGRNAMFVEVDETEEEGMARARVSAISLVNDIRKNRGMEPAPPSAVSAASTGGGEAKARDILWCSAILRTQRWNAELGALACDTAELLHCFNEHRPNKEATEPVYISSRPAAGEGNGNG